MHYVAVWLLLALGNGESVSEAQETSCPDSRGCHVVPYLYAETSGGFIGKARNISEPPRFTMRCGGDGITGISKILEPDSKGLIIQEFGPLDPHMYCSGNEVLSNRISGLEDGGWFWITRGPEVAVAPLLARSVLRNRKVRFVDPGYGVTLDRRRYATLLEENSTGRLVMMLNVMPEAEPPPTVDCGPVVVKVGEDEYQYRQQFSRCLVGDGGTYIQFSLYGPGGSLDPITEGAVNRPFSGEYAVDLSLWLNESGSISYGEDPTVGWNSIAGAHPLNVTNWSIALAYTRPGFTLGDAGIDDSDVNGGHFVVKSSERYCSEGNRQSIKIIARAYVSSRSNPITPPPRSASSNLTIGCPPLAQEQRGADEGVELVPHAGIGTDSRQR